MEISIPKIREYTKNTIIGRWGQLISKSLLYLLSLMVVALIIAIPLLLIFKQIFHFNFESFRTIGKIPGNPYFNLIFSLIFSIPTACITIGYIHFIMEFIKRKTMTFSRMLNFGFQKKYRSLVVAGLTITMISAIINFIDTIIENYSVFNKILQPILLIVLTIIGIWISLRLNFSLYIGLDNPDMSTKELLQASWKLMRGKIYNFIIVMLKWVVFFIIFGILTLGIALIWIAPIMAVTTTIYYFTITNQDAVLSAIPRFFENNETTSTPKTT